MKNSFKEALIHRRSYYAIGAESPITDAQIEELVNFTLTHTPSAFNSQSSRVVLLLGEHHKILWQIVLEKLQRIVPEGAFEATQAKIDSFSAGHGTVLYLEDQQVVKTLQGTFPLYADNFPGWSQQTSAMHQLTLWTLLEQAGLGASLQHYNPLIDIAVQEQWDLPQSWTLVAQMPFGAPTAQPAEKTMEPLSDRIRVFK